MVDLGHGLAELGEPGAGVEGGDEIDLHAAKLGLGPSDLIGAAGGLDPGLGVLGVGAEALHGPRDALHGFDEEGVEREVDRRPCQRRDEQHHRDEAGEIGQQLLAQRFVRGDDLDKFARAEARLGDDADHPPLAAEEGVERRGEPGARVLAAQVDEVGRLHRARRGQHQAAHAVLLDGHGDDAGAVEQLLRELAGDLAVGRNLRRQRGQFGGADAVEQPLLFEGGEDRRQDQQAGERDKQGGEDQQARREAARPVEAPVALADRLLGGLGVSHGPLLHHASRLRKETSRRVRPEKRTGV